MPRYFFDVQDGGTTIDDTGTDLPDYKTAREQAIEVLPHLARDYLPDGDRRLFQVLVRDERGTSLFRATLSFHCEKLA